LPALREVGRETGELSTAENAKNMIGPEKTAVPMRDGATLPTEVWKPTEGTFPAILTRAYRPGFARDHERFTAAGYVYVGQQTRNDGGSDGSRFLHDARDGYDALTWVAAQPWCNGDIAMYGKSYWAATQWLVAPEQHPHLKAIVPQNMNPDIWDCGYWRSGALNLAMTATGRAYDDVTKDKVTEYGWEKFYRHLPLIDLDEAVAGRPNRLWKDYITHSSYDDYWQSFSIRNRYRRIRIPAYLMCGWYDYYTGATFRYYNRLKKLGAASEIRVIVNPGDHLNRIPGDRDFGPDAPKDEVGLAVEWLDFLFRGTNAEIGSEAPIRIFVMGANQWRGEWEWPLARTEFTPYYLHGHGGLDTIPPGDESPATYIYDPENPVPALGGNHSCLEVESGLVSTGPVDQRSNEDREDILIFTSDPVEVDTEVTGPIVVKLHAATDGTDTDFVAKLIDVYPDGTAFNLTEGIIRARFRESIWEPPRLLEPGEIYEYTIELLPTSNLFLRGHSIRVHITSSNFPLWDRNPNTGHPQGMDAEMRIAHQTIFHDRLHPSHILLPIIPKSA